MKETTRVKLTKSLLVFDGLMNVLAIFATAPLWNPNIHTTWIRPMALARVEVNIALISAVLGITGGIIAVHHNFKSGTRRQYAYSLLGVFLCLTPLFVSMAALHLTAAIRGWEIAD